MTDELGLELTCNSKVGWAFSLSRSRSCINATATCRKACYGNGVRYQSDAQKAKRDRNFRTVEFLLDRGGPELLAQNLIALVDQARPRDWLAAQISGAATALPWTLRIHDVGDAHSVRYVKAWTITVLQRPLCRFWLYTHSFCEPDLLAALSELVSQPNCRGFLSIDTDNFEAGLRAFAAYPGVWKLALLQEEESKLPAELLPAIKKAARQGDVISFPYHRGGFHVRPILAEPLVLCPQITTKALPLQTSPQALKPCQSCAFCLPV